MSRSLPATISTMVTNNSFTLAFCIKITPVVGTAFGFTNHDQDLTFGSVTYASNSGLTDTNISQNSTLSVTNLNFEAFLGTSNTALADLNAGKWDAAAIEAFLVDYTDPTGGSLNILNGTVGELRLSRDIVSFEYRGFEQHLDQNVIEVYTPSDKATLGDARNGLNEATYTQSSVAVTGVTSNKVFTASSLGQADDFFNQGKLLFVTGDNAGLEMEVQDFGSGQITLFLAMPYDVQIGDTFDIVQGYDGSLSQAKDTFNNVINFRGFPNLPGNDQIARHGSQQ